MAFAIMIYHMVSWELFHPESGSLLGNIKDFQTSIVFFIRR
ncbi:hypothetical protein OXA12_10745 [Acinetobacter baumannii]|nr:hypothetical protein [Acinetobacter baumannii]